MLTYELICDLKITSAEMIYFVSRAEECHKKEKWTHELLFHVGISLNGMWGNLYVIIKWLKIIANLCRCPYYPQNKLKAQNCLSGCGFVLFTRLNLFHLTARLLQTGIQRKQAIIFMSYSRYIYFKIYFWFRKERSSKSFWIIAMLSTEFLYKNVL